MATRITKVVIPIAGLGTRLLPVTRTVPKALLPIIEKPIIHYAVEEAAAAGAEDVILVVNPGSESITGYFGPQPVLEKVLEERGKKAELAQQRAIAKLARVHAVAQLEPRGLGHAVLMAQEFVGNEPFGVILPDDLIMGRKPAIGQLIDVWQKYGGSVIAAKEVPIEAVERLGIISGKAIDNRVWKVDRLVEKPKRAEAPSRMAIIGRYVLSPKVFTALQEGRTGAGGEIQLTDAIAATLGSEPVHACAFEGAHIDTGIPQGMVAAAIFRARQDPKFHADVERMLADAEKGAQAQG